MLKGQTMTKMSTNHKKKTTTSTKATQSIVVASPGYISPTASCVPEEDQPKTVYIGYGSQFWTVVSPSHTVMWQPPAKFPNLEAATICYVSEVRDPEISIFRHPKQTEEVHFDGYISHHNFDIFILPLTNLKVFEIHISTLENLNFPRRIGFPNFLNLPKLESLQISSFNFTRNHISKFKMEKVMINICCLLSKTFPSLNYLAVSLPLLKDKDQELSQAVLKCIKTHHRTLKSLNIELTFDASFSLLDDSKTTNKSTSFTAEALLLSLSDSRMIQLHSFHYFSTYRMDSTLFWRNFMMTQEKLGYVQFWCGEKYFPLPTQLILQNSSNLHTIALNINQLLATKTGVKRSHVDCGVFSKCYLLKTLVLKGKKVENRVPSSSSNCKKLADIKNCRLLPQGLEQIRIIHLKMCSTDTTALARNMSKLKSLYLEDIGSDGELGLALVDLVHLLGKPDRTLVHLDIHNGLNKTSFKDVHADDGFATVARILFKIQKPDSFCVRLQPDGEYDIAESLEEEDTILQEKEVFHENFQAMVTDDDLMKRETDSDVVLLPDVNSNRHSYRYESSKKYNTEMMKKANATNVGVGTHGFNDKKGKFGKEH